MIQPINKDQYNNLITLQNIDSMYPYILLFLSLSTCLRNNGKMKKCQNRRFVPLYLTLFASSMTTVSV